MAKPLIEAITEHSLSEFSVFLENNMSVQRPAADWEAGLRHSWCENRPNFGFMLRDQGEVVGGVGAIYADRLIRGQRERFCNITSWCVKDAYRQQSMRMVMALLAQPGIHFTDFSPTQVVGATLRFLKFKPLDERQVVFANLPAVFSSMTVVNKSENLTQVLKHQDFDDYQAHRQFPWLRHLAIGQGQDWCYVIYKRQKIRNLPAAKIIYISNPKILQQGLGKLAAHLLFQGFPATIIERRWLHQPPLISITQSGFNAKVYLSSSLSESDIDYLYSETMAFDLN